MPGLIYNSFAFDLGIQSENALQKLKNSPELLQKKIAELSQCVLHSIISFSGTNAAPVAFGKLTFLVV